MAKAKSTTTSPAGGVFSLPSTDDRFNYKELFSAKDLDGALYRIAHEILEQKDLDPKSIVFAGILNGGVPITKRLKEIFADIAGVSPESCDVNISRFRDDRDPEAEFHGGSPDFAITDMNVVLIDDVIYTGRTARAAMNAVFDLGRPASVTFAAVVDRGHHEMPIRPNFVGKNIPTHKNEYIKVQLESGIFLGTPLVAAVEL